MIHLTFPNLNYHICENFHYDGQPSTLLQQGWPNHHGEHPNFKCIEMLMIIKINT